MIFHSKRLVCITFLIYILSVDVVYTMSYDDDTTLEFYWGATTGNVDHYDVYVSVNDGEYTKVGEVSSAPTSAHPYPLPLVAEHGSTYTIRVQAVDPDGNTGPMSNPSGIVECRLYSAPGKRPTPHHNGG